MQFQEIKPKNEHDLFVSQDFNYQSDAGSNIKLVTPRQLENLMQGANQALSSGRMKGTDTKKLVSSFMKKANQGKKLYKMEESSKKNQLE